MKKISIKPLLLFFVIIAIPLGFAIGYSIKPPEKIFQDKPGQHYFADEFMVVAKDGDNDIILHLDLNRKETEKGDYIHYYWTELLYNNSIAKNYVSFNDPASAVTTQKLFTNFEHKPFEDLSSRESYTVIFNLDGHTVQVNIPELQGDFIVKNSLEYTKYISEAKAHLVIDGKALEGRAALTKIYTPDYSKYVFFNGYNTLKTTTHNFMVWDEEGDFYAIDASDVTSINPDYASHRWILFKDGTTGATLKAFDATIQFEKNPDGTPKLWNIGIPDLNKNMKIMPQTIWQNENKRVEGVATGTVEVNNKSLKAFGVFTYLSLE